MLRQLLELVNGVVVEVEQGGPRGGVGEEAGKSSRRTRLEELGAPLDRGKKTESGPHDGGVLRAQCGGGADGSCIAARY